ncbi:35959_t:CDS:1, partial [Gigaspora margarita]
EEDFFNITVVPVSHEKDQQKLDICETQSNATVEENNSISVTQKSYSQAVTGSVSYARANDWEDIVRDRKREL